MNKIITGLCAMIVSFVFVGCGSNQIPTVPVDITIKYNGKEVEEALVTLAPKTRNGDERTGTGMTDANGKANITTPGGGKGAMPGEYKVIVMKTPLIGQGGGGDQTTPTYSSYEEAVAASERTRSMPKIDAKHQLPVKYAAEQTTDLEIVVKKGEKNIWTLELKD